MAFELTDARADSSGDSTVLGVWRELDGPAREEEPETLLWRVGVPACPDAAAERLSVSESRLCVSEEAMASVGPRLGQTMAAGLDAAVAFPADVGLGLSGEAELAAWLQTAGRVTATASFASGGPVSGWMRQAEEDLARFVERARRWCSPTAQVETDTGDAAVARSVLGATGRMATVWRSGLSLDEIALHERAVVLVVASRAALLRTVATVASGAAAVAGRLALPGGALLALPAVWRFVRHVIGDALAGHERRSVGPG